MLDRVATRPIVLMGTSLGAAIALQAAAVDRRVAAVVAVSPFSDLRTAAIERAPWFASKGNIAEAFRLAEAEGKFRVDDASPVAAAPRIAAPTLLIHGAKDDETPAAHSQRIFAALHDPKRLILVPNADHNHVIDAQVWREIDDLGRRGARGAGRARGRDTSPCRLASWASWRRCSRGAAAPVRARRCHANRTSSTSSTTRSISRSIAIRSASSDTSKSPFAAHATVWPSSRSRATVSSSRPRRLRPGRRWSTPNRRIGSRFDCRPRWYATSGARWRSRYETTAPRGVAFRADAVYTGFFTCHWMICRERPDDKATLALSIDVPDGLSVVANGVPVASAAAALQGDGATNGTSRCLRLPICSDSRSESSSGPNAARSGARFEYHAAGADGARLQAWFADDDRMLAFFVDKAGRGLPRPFYRQVVVDGGVAQEMSSFSLLGREVLEPARD